MRGRRAETIATEQFVAVVVASDGDPVVGKYTKTRDRAEACEKFAAYVLSVSPGEKVQLRHRPAGKQRYRLIDQRGPF